MKMAFNNILKLNSIVANGFLMNDIITLSKKENYSLEKKDKILIFNKALIYINLIKDGKNFMLKQIHIDKLNESLDAYSTALSALEESEEKETQNAFTFDRFNEIITKSENEIKDCLQNNVINTENLSMAKYLFNS